jgi:hypothetical protein
MFIDLKPVSARAFSTSLLFCAPPNLGLILYKLEKHYIIAPILWLSSPSSLSSPFSPLLINTRKIGCGINMQ